MVFFNEGFPKWGSEEDGKSKLNIESLNEGAKIKGLSEGQERMAMATQNIVKGKLSGKQKSKWGCQNRKSK